jgi:hypothetical protein
MKSLYRNNQITTEITKIDLEHFDPKDHSKASKAFIRLDNFNELFHFTFNVIIKIKVFYEW